MENEITVEEGSPMDKFVKEVRFWSFSYGVIAGGVAGVVIALVLIAGR